MKKATRWLSLLCVVGVGFVAVSCDEESTTSVTDVTTPTTTETAATPETAAPSFDVGVLGVDVWGDCLNEDINDQPDGTLFNNATCAANDVEIKVLEALSVNFGSGPVPIPPGGTVTCTEGETFEVELRAYFGFNREETYDIAYFLAEDGGDARIGDCFHGFLEPIDDNGAGTPTAGSPYNGPYRDAEHGTDPADICGDAQENDEVDIPGISDGIGAVKDVPETVTVTCEDDDDDGFVEIGTCTSWDINASNGGNKPTCEGVEDAFPGTPAKCNCRPAPLPINVMRSATVKVIKDVVEDDGSLWTLTIASPSLISDVTGNKGDLEFIETAIEWFRDDEPGANKATVTEAYHSLGALSGAFYTSTYSCNSTNDAHDISTTSGRSIPEFSDLVNNESIVCTFVNTRIPVPTVTVTKDATPTYTKEWDWTITKNAYFTANDALIPSGTILGAGPPIALPGMVYDVYYIVAGTPTASEKDFAVSGTITVAVAGSLPPYSGNFTVTDALTGGINATVDCDPTAGVSNTKAVTAAGSFTCTYAASLPDKTARTNTATAAVTWNSGDTDSQTGTAAVTFGAPTTEIDELALVCDDKGTSPVSNPCLTTSGDYLGSSTAPAPYSFRYDNDIPACVPPGFDRLNTALLTEVDTDTDRTANHALSSVCQDPPPGCTLTQGYWKTHSEFGPAPYDDNWGNVVGTAATCADGAPDSNGGGTGASVAFDDFFGSGVVGSAVCYHDVFWTPPKGGNSWYQLAHQYIAAQLNVLNGAGTTAAVDAALAAAETLLANHPNKKIPKKSDDEGFAKDYAKTLTQYNEGDIGPGHCDDDQYPDLLFF